MKLLFRGFNASEKALLALLGVVLVGLVYYQFVHRTVVQGTEEALARQAALETELLRHQERLSQLRRMKEELETPGARSSYMPSYNSYQEEVTLLNSILQGAGQYSVSFSNPSREGEQVRRGFTLSFTAASYSDAKAMIQRLSDSEIRCLVNSVAFSGPMDGSGEAAVNLTGVFYETMSGGEPDVFLTGS